MQSFFEDAADTKEICSYGIELALHTFLSTAGLLIIGMLMHHLLEAAVIISIYYANQTIGGGFHRLWMNGQLSRKLCL